MAFPQRKGPSGPQNTLGGGRDRFQWSGGGTDDSTGFEDDLTDAIISSVITPGDSLVNDGASQQGFGAQRLNYTGNLILGNLQLVNFNEGDVDDAVFSDPVTFTLRVGSFDQLFPPAQMLPAKAQLVVPGGTILLIEKEDVFESTDWTAVGGGAPVLSVPVTEGQYALISFDTGSTSTEIDLVAVWVAWILEG